MSREKKKQIISELEQILAKCSAAVFTDYRGLSTAELTELRRRLRQSGVGYRVVKNTLARFSAERAGKSYLLDLIEGPVAIAFGYGEITQPAKLLVDHINSSRSELSIKGGFVGARRLTSGEVVAMAKLPSREVLLAKVLAGMQSPIVTLVSCLSSPMRGLVGVLQARIKKMEVV